MAPSYNYLILKGYIFRISYVNIYQFRIDRFIYVVGCRRSR